jgi:CBS domain-containing protein
MADDQKIRDLMVPVPVMVDGRVSLVDVARAMRDGAVGEVLVIDGAEFGGILSDRDITVRAVAGGLDPATTPASAIAIIDTFAAGPDDTVAEAVELMRSLGVRRLPVVEHGRPCGIVTLDDLALALDFNLQPKPTETTPPRR